ncbi:MAG: TRAP transporter small permease subunit [Deltaproteobacteria bacterium]|nr:TRAP transporter small permease subunit [Deltaproteobacteria bacterium]
MTKGLKVIEAVNIWVGRIASYLILAIVGVVMFEVLARYIFNAPTKWSNEISQYMLAAVAMLGGAFCLVDGGHVRVDIFYRGFSPRMRAIVEVMSCAMVVLFVLAIVWKGGELCYEALIENKKSMTILELPLFPSMFMVPLGAFLLGLQSIARALRGLLLLMGGDSPEIRAMFEG